MLASPAQNLGGRQLFVYVPDMDLPLNSAALHTPLYIYREREFQAAR